MSKLSLIFDETVLFDRLVASNPQEVERKGTMNFVHDISSKTLDAIKVVTEFGTLIISFINLYLKLKENKNQRLKTKMEKLEIEEKLKDEMLKYGPGISTTTFASNSAARK